MAEATAVAVAEAEAITEARPPARSSARSTCASASQMAAVEVAIDDGGDGGGDSGGRGGGGGGSSVEGDDGEHGGGGDDGGVEPVHTDAPEGAPPSGNANLHSTQALQGLGHAGSSRLDKLDKGNELGTRHARAWRRRRRRCVGRLVGVRRPQHPSEGEGGPFDAGGPHPLRRAPGSPRCGAAQLSHHLQEARRRVVVSQLDRTVCH